MSYSDAERCPACGHEVTEPFERDPDEPVAHINRLVHELLTCEDAHPYEDAINIIYGVVLAVNTATGGN